MENFARKTAFGRHELVVEQKAKKRIKSKICFIFLLLLANLSLLLFLRSPLFTIAVISIQGLDKLPASEVRQVMGIREGMNIWKVSPPELRGRIFTLPRVAEVEVERVLPDKLLIRIREKHALALAPYHGNYLELAADGTMIGIRNECTGELPLISGLLQGQMSLGLKIADQDQGEIIAAFLDAFQGTVSPPPLAEINVENPEQIIAYTWEGMEVWLGNKTDLSKKIEVLKCIHAHIFSFSADATKGYLDLRVIEMPVFRSFENNS